MELSGGELSILIHWLWLIQLIQQSNSARNFDFNFISKATATAYRQTNAISRIELANRNRRLLATCELLAVR